MPHKFLFAVTLILTSGFVLAQKPVDSPQNDFSIDVDRPAEFPGGLESFFQFITTNLVYPTDARKNNIEGKTFVEFIVDKEGYIVTNSVKSIKGLYPSCDKEAVRVIKLCKTKWTSAIKDGMAVAQSFVLPIAFKFTPDAVEGGQPLNPLKNAIKTRVVDTPANATDRKSWAIYKDAEWTSPSGNISVGDTVEVIGWAPRSYFIRSRSQRGYVSLKSLASTPELDSLSNLIAVQTEIEDQSRKRASEAEFYNSMKPMAHFSVESNKYYLQTGECATVTLAFNVAKLNRVRLQFYELGAELSTMMAGLTPDNCWIVNGGIENIEGETIRLENQDFTRYKIYQGSYCPVKPGLLKIPSLNLQIARIKLHSMEIDTMLTFQSQPLSIKVTSIPPSMSASSFDAYTLVGRFRINEDIHPEKVSVGELVTYKLTVAGSGLTFPIEAPTIDIENVESQLVNIIDEDSVTNTELKSKKTFVYHLTFKKAGTYDFSKKITFQYFDMYEKRVKPIHAKKVVNVQNGVAKAPPSIYKTFYSQNNFIAIDASQSMEIEDYEPNRLKAVTGGVAKFLTNRSTCDIGVIVFRGDAKHLTEMDTCYSLPSFQSITTRSNNRGTAIGDAIWLAKNSFAKTTFPKKLVIIGDGDNTAGHLSPKFAAQLAQNHDVKIYTIGVGTKGLVPYGKDASGKPNMIDNTFTDKDFKTISTITNGQYYWAKDETEVTRILELIFK